MKTITQAVQEGTKGKGSVEVMALKELSDADLLV